MNENVVKKEQLYEGKAKKIFATSDPGLVIMEYKDSATAFNGAKKGTIEDKGIMNNEISAKLYELLNSWDVPTHFIKKLSDREVLCKKVKIIPLEVIVRNVAAGSFVQVRRTRRSAHQRLSRGRYRSRNVG